MFRCKFSSAHVFHPESFLAVSLQRPVSTTRIFPSSSGRQLPSRAVQTRHFSTKKSPAASRRLCSLRLCSCKSHTCCCKLRHQTACSFHRSFSTSSTPSSARSRNPGFISPFQNASKNTSFRSQHRFALLTSPFVVSAVFARKFHALSPRNCAPISLQRLLSLSLKSFSAHNRGFLSSVYSSKVVRVPILCQPFSTGNNDDQRTKNINLGLKLAILVVFMIGMSYAAVPLYQIFCQRFGIGGTTQVDSQLEKLKDWRAGGSKSDREILVRFAANKNFNMPWEFWPTHSEVRTKVGETCLAFFTAKNKADYPVVGVATYNVVPMRAGLYFNKIQCFCFDEQRLLPGEQIDMPVFFFLDPKWLEDPKMEPVREITLSYTFFPASDWEEEEEDGKTVSALEVQRQIEAQKKAAVKEQLAEIQKAKAAAPKEQPVETPNAAAPKAVKERPVETPKAGVTEKAAAPKATKEPPVEAPKEQPKEAAKPQKSD